MASNVRSLDPIQGFVDYVLDIKPYHSKILEVLIEYVHTDVITVTVDEKLEWEIDIDQPGFLEAHGCDLAYGSVPYGGGAGNPILTIDDVNDSFIIPGDFVAAFPVGTDVRIVAHMVDDVTGAVISSEAPTGDYTILSATLDPGSPGVDPSTTITVSPDIAGPIPTAGPGEIYVATLYYQPIDIVDVIPTNVLENAVLNIGSNMFVVDGLHTPRFQQGIQFVIDGGANEGTYTTLYSDFVAGQTRIRVKETIPTTEVSGRLKPIVAGFDYIPPICSQIDAALVAVTIDEHLQFTGMELVFSDNVVVYNMENTDEDGFGIDPYSSLLSEPATVGGFSQEPNTFYHSSDSVAIDAVNHAIELSGGDFHQRFTPDTPLTGYNITTPTPGNLELGPFQPKSYPVINTNGTAKTTTIAGDLTWLFTAGRIFTIMLQGNINMSYEVVSSTFDGTNTIIETTVAPPDTVFQNPDLTNIEQDYTGDFGVIIGAVFEPAFVNSLSNPVTIVDVYPSADVSDNITDVESISYVREGPLRLNISTHACEDCTATITDAMIADAISIDVAIASSQYDVPSYDEGAYDADLFEFNVQA